MRERVGHHRTRGMGGMQSNHKDPVEQASALIHNAQAMVPASEEFIPSVCVPRECRWRTLVQPDP